MPKKSRKKTQKTTSVSRSRSATKKVKLASRIKSPTKPAAKKIAKSREKAPQASVKKVLARKASPKTSADQKPAVKNAAAKQAIIPTKSAVLEAGRAAPDFNLPRDGGQRVSLADFSGRKLVIFFYPRADTPGCTREAIDFSRLSKAFAASQTAVLGVSSDPLKAQEAFRDKHQLNMPLGSDEQHAMLNAYGAWGEKSVYGKVFQGVLRTTVLVDVDGRIAKIWRNVKVDGHADDVLATARSL